MTIGQEWVYAVRVFQLPTTSYQPPALASSLSNERRCAKCGTPIAEQERLNKRFCQAKCRAFVWSRMNRQFSSAITVADFANVRMQIKQFEERLKKRVIGYTLLKAHPVFEVAERIGKSAFPPKSRKTKRFPDARGRVCFSKTLYFGFEPFEGPRVPVVGYYNLVVWFEGATAPFVTGEHVEIRKAFPACLFEDEKTGCSYNLKGDLISPKPTDRKPAAAGTLPRQGLGQAPNPPVVPLIAEERPDAALLSRVQSLEARLERQDRERAEMLASMERERRQHNSIRRELEEKLRAATLSKVPPRDVSARLAAEEQHNRALDEKLKQVETLLQEHEQKITRLSTERDELARQVKSVSSERDELAQTVRKLSSERATLAEGILKLEGRREDQTTTAAKAQRDRDELTTRLPAIERQRDELVAERERESSRTETHREGNEGEDANDEGKGTELTAPSSPTGIVIPRLALGGNQPSVSSPKTGPPSLGILGQKHRPPIRGSANKKHKRR